MALFKKKKPEVKKEELPPLKFPEIPEFPSYERKIPSPEEMDIPIRKQEIKERPELNLPQKKLALPPIERPMPKALPPMAMMSSPPKMAPMPTMQREEQEMEMAEPMPMKEEKELFIKIDKYELIVETLRNIRNKVRGTEKILMKLESVYADEERQLDSWRKDLENIKDKLSNIDKKLFEE